jgi:sugar/nucleoside kinase (ribokinase family)
LNKTYNPLADHSLGPTITIGEILVEIMSTTKGNGFLEAQPLTGPYPSGAPAIFIDQVGKLGQDAGIIAAVGKDDFGQLNIDRLSTDGVDVTAIDVLKDHPTGYAFVRYREDGERDFVFSIATSAAGQIQRSSATDTLINRAGHLHIMGTALTLPGAWPIVQQAVTAVKSRGGSISFDPNMRKELNQSTETEQRIAYLLEQADLFMPSGDEVSLLGEGEDEKQLINDWLEGTGKEIVLKQGAKGAMCFQETTTVERTSIPAVEVDPTGAGDCFGATYVTCRRLGYSLEKALDFANAAGHCAVSKQGPMEGNAGFAELQAILDSQ